MKTDNHAVKHTATTHPPYLIGKNISIKPVPLLYFIILIITVLYKFLLKYVIEKAVILQNSNLQSIPKYFGFLSF